MSISNPPVVMSEAVSSRVLHLATALRRLGIGDNSTVVVVCCPTHAQDAAAAVGAANFLGATVVSESPDEVDGLPDALSPTVILACAEGTEAWQASGRRGRLIGDAPGVLWWRALELGGRQDSGRAC